MMKRKVVRSRIAIFNGKSLPGPWSDITASYLTTLRPVLDSILVLRQCFELGTERNIEVSTLDL